MPLSSSHSGIPCAVVHALLPNQPLLLSSERLAKYNQLLRIEQELGADAVYAGEDWRFIAIA